MALLPQLRHRAVKTLVGSTTGQSNLRDFNQLLGDSLIPHHFHLIWIGKHFPFVNRLAVESLIQTNPKAKITIHFQDPSNNTDWQVLQGKVEFRPIDLQALLNDLPDSMQSVVPVLEKISDSYLAGKSNILRYLILYREGGIYLDFDTITVRDYTPLLNTTAFIGEEIVFKYDDDRVSGNFKFGIIPAGFFFGVSYYLAFWNCKYFHNSKFLNAVQKTAMRFWSDQKLNNAILACEKHSSFFAEALALVPKTDPKIKYALGPILMNRTWDELNRDKNQSIEKTITRYSTEYFYAIPPSQTFRFFYGPAQALPDKTYTLHWCSSNHKNLAATLTLENLRKRVPNPTLFHKLACEIIEKGI